MVDLSQYQYVFVFMLVGGFISFFIYAFIHSRRQEKINKDIQNKEK